MTVFRGYLRGALRQKAVIILYLAIFLGLGTLMTMTMDENTAGNYEAQSLSMAVVDRDHSEISEGLVKYLDKSQDLKAVKDDKKVLQEELYYGNIQYVLVIPDGFEDTFINRADADSKETGGLLEGTGRPGSTQSYYAEELAESYLKGISLYLDAGYEAEDAVTRMMETGENDSSAEMAQGSSSMSKVAGTFQYLPYILTALSCYVIGFVMLDYQKLDIRRRLAVSATSFSRRLAEMLLAFLVIGAAFYAVSFLMTALMNVNGIFKEPNMQYYALNVLTMVLVGLSVAFLVVHLAGTANGVNGLANAIALGMSFICGVFIPDSMLSTSVKNLARFLPVYWYEQNNTILGTHTLLSESMVGKLWTGYRWQVVFTFIAFAAAIVVRKIKER